MSKRVLRKPDVLKKVGVSKTQLQTLIDAGEFPGAIKLGGPEARAIGWIESEIDTWIDQKVAERDAALASSTRMSLDTENRYAALALAGICSACGQSMPALSQEEIQERLEECEDDPFECDRCSIDTLILAGWEVETFTECLPDFMQGSLKGYILAACERRRAKTESPRMEA